MGVAVAPEASPLSTPPPSGPLPLIRWGLVGAILLVEYLAVSLAFDVQPLRARASWIGWTGDAAAILLAALAAALALARAPNAAAVADVRARLRPLPSVWIWGAAHALAALAFFALTAMIGRGGPTPDAVPAWLPALWAVAVTAVVITCVGVAIPLRACVAAARLAARPVAAGVVGGVLAWSVARATESLWPLLSRTTLAGAAALLRIAAPGEMFADPELLYLGFGDFVVEISAECSGIQGMGLIATLTIAYLIRFRGGLRFPRAIAVVPLGIAIVFLANMMRIALLVWVGGRYSPDVALGGFHSKAGWLMNCVIALALLFQIRRSRSLARDAGSSGDATVADPPGNPTVPYLIPLMVNLALLLLTGAAVTSFDTYYPIRAAIVLAVLVGLRPWRHWQGRFDWRPSPAAILIGILLMPVWLLLVSESPAAGDPTLLEGLATLPPAGKAIWIGTRILGGVLLTPVIEELAFRGYLLRRLHTADFDRTSYRAALTRPLPLLASSLAFGLVHHSFIAGTVAGAAYALALMPRGRLLDAVAAHVATNAALLVFAAATSGWHIVG